MSASGARATLVRIERMGGTIMDTPVVAAQRSGMWTNAMERWRRNAWLLILIADVGLLAWCLMAAVAPGHLIGPGSRPILAAGYEGFTRGSWQDLVATFPRAADYMTVLFRMFGIYGIGLSALTITIAANGFRRGERWTWWALLVGNTIGYGAAMVYDQVVRAVGPFELTEYLGLALIFGSLAVTAPFGSRHRAPSGASDGEPRPL
jgi:hypothetical protein